jgi:hypothetical protein
MKKSILFAALATVALSAPLAYADDAHHPDQNKKTAPAKSSKTADAADKQTDKQMGQMQAQMDKMQAQMGKIRQTTDPQERQKLMQEHMQSMREGMKMMRGMCEGMMGGGMMGEGMMGGDMMKGDDMMEKRMEMMLTIMEQMMEHQSQQDMQMAK